MITDLVYAQTGDRIWWNWNGENLARLKQIFTIKEVERCLNPMAKKPDTPSSEGTHISVMNLK
jgi:hypothetical protein